VEAFHQRMGFAKRAGGRKFPAMAFFKRPEVWVLLLLSAAGIAWVLWSDQAGDEARGRNTTAHENGASPTHAANREDDRFVVHERRVSREEDHLILTLRVGAGKSNTLEEALDLTPPAARLLAADDSRISEFFLPFAPPPLLDPEPGSVVELRYWLPVAQAATALWLEIDGERLAVKQATPEKESGPFLQRFPEGIEVAVYGLDWKP